MNRVPKQGRFKYTCKRCFIYRKDDSTAVDRRGKESTNA